MSGNPSPQVTWWRENELVDSTYERTYTHVVQNSIKIGPLGARHLGATYTCISSNNNISAPVSRKVSLDILFPPTDVSITSVGQPLVAGTTYVISCEAAGPREVPGAAHRRIPDWSQKRGPGRPRDPVSRFVAGHRGPSALFFAQALAIANDEEKYTKDFPANKCPCWWDLTRNNCACCKVSY